MEGSVNGLGGNLGNLDPKEGKEAADVEKKMSFDLVAEFMKKTQEELLQLADMNQSDQKICMLEKELLQIKDAVKVKDDKIDMMEDKILQLKADSKERDGKIEAVHEAIESLDHRLVAKNQRILLLEDHIPVVNTGDEAAVEKARVKAAATPNFKKLAIFVGVPILVALATKKLG